MFDLANVNIVTFNVNGIRESQKRRAIFHYLKTFQSHIVLLQETHSTKETERAWVNEWGGSIAFNHGTAAARGVAVLLGRNFPGKIETVRQDLEGRLLIVDMKVGGHNFVLVNVYAPNEDDPEFFVKVFDAAENRQNDSMIIAGDFNTTLDPERDLYNNQGATHVKKRAVIREYMEMKGLIDIWRVKHPDQNTFS